MAKLGDLVVNIGANTKDLNKKLGAVRRDMRQMSSNFKAVGANMTRSLTLPLVAIGAASANLAIEFESSMAAVKAVSGATAGEFKALEQSAKDLGASTVFTARDVAALQLEYSRLGFSAAEILNVQEATLNLAQATGSDLAQAAEVAGSTLRGFGMDASETAKVTDIMAASFSASALNINTFQDSMKFVAPDAKAAGVSIEEVSAMLAVLANSGIKGSQAGTALRRILQEMTGTSGTLSERFAELGAKGIGVKDAMDEVGRRAGTSLIVLSDGADQVKALTGEFENSEGAAKSMSDVMNAATKGGLKEMTSALEGAGIALGEILIPVIKDAANFIKDLANDFKALNKDTQENIVIFGGLVAALGPLMIAVATLASSLPVIGGALAAMTGPVGLVVIGVTGLAVAFNEIITAATGVPTTLEAANAAVKDHTAEVRFLVEQYKDESKSLEDREKILKRLNEIDSTHFTNLEAENTTYTDLVKNLDSYTAALRRNFIEKSFAEQGKELFSTLADDEAAINKKRATLQKAIDIEANANRITRDAARKNRIQIQGELEDLQAQRDQTLIDIEAFEIEKLALLEKYASTDPGATDPGATESSTSASSSSSSSTGGGLIKQTKEYGTELKSLLMDLEGMSTVITQDLTNGVQTFTVQSAEQLLLFLDDFSVGVEGVAKKIDDTVNVTSTAFKDLGQNITDAFVDAVFEAQNFGEAMKLIGKQILKTLLSEAIGSAIASAASNKNLANQASGGLTIPAFIAGAVGSVKAAFGGVPALAGGGLAFGETMSIVGDNRNAAIDPEVIAPLSKLEKYLGNGSTNVYGRISGDDIVISNTRGARDRNRFV